MSSNEKSGGRKRTGGILRPPNCGGWIVNIRPPKWRNSIWIKIEDLEVAQYVADAVFHFTGRPPFHFPDVKFDYPPLFLKTGESLTTREECSAYVTKIAKDPALRDRRKDFEVRVRKLILEMVKRPEVVRFLSTVRASPCQAWQGGSSNPERRRLDSKILPSVRRLGKGLSGFLYETTWEGNKYVRKDFPLGSVHHNVFEKEANALLDLDHPNIVRCPYYTVGKSSCSLLLEYVDDDLQNIIQKKIEAQRKGNRTGSSITLHSRLLDIDETRSLMSSKAKGREITGADVGLMEMPENEPTPFEVPQAVDIIFKIAAGMKYLHDNGIVHGDLKPKNVLVGNDGIVKLVDYGLVETKKKIKLVSKRTRHFEILMWKAPERFEKLLGPVTEDSDDPFTDSDTDSDDEIESRWAMADVYSFGLVCSQVLGGKIMYSNLSLTQLREQRMHDFRPQLPSTCPEDLRSLIFSSVNVDPRCRPTFTDIYTALKAFQSNKRPRLMLGVDFIETSVVRGSAEYGGRVFSADSDGER